MKVGHYKYTLLFILVISISFAPFICIYAIIFGAPQDILSTIILNMPVCLLIGVSDYLIIRRMDNINFNNRYLRLLTDMVITSMVCIGIIAGLNYLISDFGWRELLRSAIPAMPWNWVVTLLIELFFSSNRQQEIEKEKAKYQLEALRNQINPHFLFNSLNVLASLAYSDGEKANIFAKRLSSVYRYLLSNTENQLVSIDDELDFVNKFLYLEQVRYGDALKVCIIDNRTDKSGYIVPASVQMLLENAIKHNVCTPQNPLAVEIKIDDESVTTYNRLCPKKVIATSGLGLKNIGRQYYFHNKSIIIRRTELDFTVKLPVIRMRCEM